MKTLTQITILILCSSLSFCQNKKYSSVLVDKADKFAIKKENKPIKIHFGDTYIETDTIRASLIVNNDSLRQIRFTKGKLEKDTLNILIHSTSPSYDHTYKIKVIGNKYIVDYQYQMDDGPPMVRKVTPTQYTVKLNSLDFKKGKEIRGYTEFQGKCSGEGCYGETDIEIKGNFKVLIK